MINVEVLDRLNEIAHARSAEDTVATMEAIATARERIDANVAPLLAMEAMLIRASRREIVSA